MPVSDCLVSYQGHSFGGWSYPSADVQSVYSTAPADSVKKKKPNIENEERKKERKKERKSN